MATTAQEVIKVLQEAGYKITPPGQPTQAYNPHRRRNIIREKLCDPNESACLLDRSQPKPDWYNPELVLQELEIQLMGVMFSDIL